MRFSFTIVLFAGLLLVSEITLGHGTEKHTEESQPVEQSPAAIPATTISSDDQSSEAPQPAAGDHSIGGQEAEDETRYAQPVIEKSAMPAKPGPASRVGKAIEDFTFKDFPTLHPMVVHVPVIMIPVAFIFGLIGLFFTSRYLVALAVVFASAGALGGFIAAFPMHPHTRGLSEAAIETLQQHDFFAYSTLGVTAFSVMVGIITLIKPNFITRGLLAVILLLASLCVSLTAHYGGTLTYVHGVGVNGNYLDAHE